MQDKHLFEYAIIRVVPRVERDEFMNAGVILYCAKQKFLQAEIFLNKEKLSAFSKTADIQEIEDNLQALKQICAGTKQSGPIGQLDLASRFRWLTAMRSTVLQTSRVHPGFCKDASEKIILLLEEQVL
ncbi:DUF3037 domain-containing protein [Pedobacter cryoconitis]|uniref:DUF3037 family protein n=1 Tax=Pedobacter cryoconitis TaxID=188932 RepID=A0A327T3W6_9SPHI|nr:DUF3037 domain-containing protein [Pedobacter cryoconitis]RAJ35562.1 Protein of unknown function (DUF3037) [Pedobacter cryoconitis]